MAELVTLEGNVESIIYANNENGYTVFSIMPSVCSYAREDRFEEIGSEARRLALEPSEEIVCVGNIAGINNGEYMRLTGSFVVHSLYGRQFQIKSFENMMPNSEISIVKYLGSGVIKGVGTKLARKIVEQFGTGTFDIIEKDPVKLSQIKGISKKKALLIAETYNKHIALKNLMLFFQELGVNSAYAVKIYNLYKENAIDIIKTNPYRLADEIYGIGFKTADSIAEKVGVLKNSIYRVKSGVKYVLSSWALNGHTFVPKHKLVEECAALMDIDADATVHALTELQLESQIVQRVVGGADVVYLSYYFHAENYCAKKLARFEEQRGEAGDTESKIALFESSRGIKLAVKQKEAVAETMSRNVLVITGGPGTGKTTAINALIYVLEQEGKDVVLAAPTGRAAKRMTEATGHSAQTIHRLLEISFMNENSVRQKFERNEENPLVCDAVIIDEVSMVDIMLLSNLLKAMPPGAKLILVGDADQLPSVGAGSVLSDIIKSGCVKVVFLDEIFRQAQLSAIVMNAHRINKGVTPVFNERETDFFFLKREAVSDTINAVLELITERLPKYAQIKNTDVQVLTPMRKSALGSLELNKVLQNRLNPPTPDKRERELRLNVFREGDKVMQVKNDYSISWITKNKRGFVTGEGTGVFNGDLGFIDEIDDDGETVTVLFDDGKYVEYDYSRMDELELAYAITIHKSQGSEYPAVIIPVLTGPYMLMTRNLLYTAVTRAKNLVVLVGLPEKINEMVGNNLEIKRCSGLKEGIVKAFSVIP